MKICSKCEVEKSEELFAPRRDRNGLRASCRECDKTQQRKRYNRHKSLSYFKHKTTRARSRAQHLKVPFDLDEEYLSSLWTGVCPVLGVEIKKSTERTDEYAAELDRFDPKVGYVKGNVAFLSRKINRLKNNASVEELERLLTWMKQK